MGACTKAWLVAMAQGGGAVNWIVIVVGGHFSLVPHGGNGQFCLRLLFGAALRSVDLFPLQSGYTAKTCDVVVGRACRGSWHVAASTVLRSSGGAVF